MTPGIAQDLLIGVWILSEAGNVVRSAVRRMPGAVRMDRGSFVGVVGGIWVGIWLAAGFSKAVPSAAFGPAGTEIFWVGFALALAGIGLRWYSVGVLGRYFTGIVQIQADHRLIEEGPYRWVRHPSYTGGLATMAGVVLTYGNWLSLLGFIPGLAGYAYRIAIEERALTAAFGDAYLIYSRRTRRLIPGVL